MSKEVNLPIHIKDEPYVSYRGLMIDSARNFMHVDTMMANLLVMSFVKLNVLHIHLSDSEGFTFDSKSFP